MIVGGRWSSHMFDFMVKLQYVHMCIYIHAAVVNEDSIVCQDWIRLTVIMQVMDCACACVRACVCETGLSKKDVGFHGNMRREGYKSVSLVTAHLLQQRTFSFSPNLCANRPPQPTSLSPASQVWYLSGWVCYLQLEKAKEQQEREGRTVTEEEEEEWKALKEAARSYLTNAKKVIQIML